MAIDKIIVDETTGVEAAQIINETIDLAESNVQSVVAGTNVTVDDTDPNNPVVNVDAAAGLVSGTGTDSMQSDASLTTTPADANGTRSIALGDGALAANQDVIAIGTNARASGPRSIYIGRGEGFIAASDSAIVMGFQAGFSNGVCSISIGRNTTAKGARGVSIGFSSRIENSTGNNSAITIGHGSGVFVANTNASIALGCGTRVEAFNAVAIGAGVTAAKADTVTVKELETCVPGGGLILTTPDGLNQPKLTVNDSQELLIGGNPVGAAGLVSGGSTGSQKSADAISDGNNSATGFRSIAIGSGNQANGSIALAIGNFTRAGNRSVAIGDNANTSLGARDNSVSIGRTANANSFAVSIGNGSNALSGCSIAIGNTACVSAAATNAVALGVCACATANAAIAIGHQVTAAKADTVTVKELETCTAGGGLILTTPDGLNQPKLTVNDSQELLIGGNPVGGGAAGLVSGTGADSMQSDASLTTVAADAIGDSTIALGNGAATDSDSNIAIGKNASALGGGGFERANIAIGLNTNVVNESSIAIGNGAQNTGDRSVSIGNNANVTGSRGVAIGVGANASAFQSVSVGGFSAASGESAIALGGFGTQATANFAISIGRESVANATCAVAIGAGVTASKADTVTVKELETCTAGGGVILTTPDGLNQYKVTIDNSGNLVTTIL